MSISTKFKLFGFLLISFSVNAPYHGQTSTIFFHSTSIVFAISSTISSLTKKFCQSDFLALILYFFNISKLIFLCIVIYLLDILFHYFFYTNL